MPSTVKKAFILSEEAYNRLTQRWSGDDRAAKDNDFCLAVNESNSMITQPHSSESIRNYSDSQTDRPETGSTTELRDHSLQVQEDQHKPQVLNSIPAKYRKTAEKVLATMNQLTNVDLDSDPVIYSGKSLDLTVEDLLKAICVPFTRISLPDELLSEFKTAGIPIRNHLAQAKVLPKWHQFFSI